MSSSGTQKTDTSSVHGYHNSHGAVLFGPMRGGPPTAECANASSASEEAHQPKVQTANGGLVRNQAGDNRNTSLSVFLMQRKLGNREFASSRKSKLGLTTFIKFDKLDDAFYRRYISYHRKDFKLSDAELLKDKNLKAAVRAHFASLQVEPADVLTALMKIQPENDAPEDVFQVEATSSVSSTNRRTRSGRVRKPKNDEEFQFYSTSYGE